MLWWMQFVTRLLQRHTKDNSIQAFDLFERPENEGKTSGTVRCKLGRRYQLSIHFHQSNSSLIQSLPALILLRRPGVRARLLAYAWDAGPPGIYQAGHSLKSMKDETNIIFLCVVRCLAMCRDTVASNTGDRGAGPRIPKLLKF